MAHKPLPQFDKDHPIWEEARSFENSVRAIRKAKGKMNPEDCERGTPEFERIEEEFLTDLLRFLPEDSSGGDGFPPDARG